jgi:hypothetical protein
MRDGRFHPRSFEEMASDPVPVSFLNEPLPPDNVGVLVPAQARPLHAVVAQTLADVEALIARLEAGVDVANSGRGLIRDLYVQSRKQREILSAVVRLELQ